MVRFKWIPRLGVHSLLLDEANIIGGVDPDYHRHDLIDAIEKGAYPEYDLGVQLIEEEKQFAYDFDILDDTKLWPEEVIPVEKVGKLTLNRLVDNFFAEEEQSVFDPGNLIPGIDFTNDPVLQGERLLIVIPNYIDSILPILKISLSTNHLLQKIIIYETAINDTASMSTK